MFADFDLKLLIATAVLVLVLLGLIYRAVLVALTPLVVVFFAYSVSTAFVYLYAKSGATVSSNGTSILIVLMFGVTTDYCLLLVSRYREELHAIEDKHEAMQRAVSRTGPTILASGLTVSLAMLTLALADAQLTSTLGPVAAIGVATGMLAGLTLLPALLTIFGRKGFWPRQGHGRLRPRPRVRAPGRRLATTRRPGSAAPRRRAGGNGASFRRRRARAPGVQGRLLHDELLQEVTSSRSTGSSSSSRSSPPALSSRPRS